MRKPSKPVIAVIVAGQVLSGALAWRDLARRPDGEIRGRKNLWRLFITVNPGNSIVYWLAGRRNRLNRRGPSARPTGACNQPAESGVAAAGANSSSSSPSGSRTTKPEP